MKKAETHYINRELSWLEFNQRVLEQARDESLPLLERLKFLAITASNLDEFFMVRVGGLQMVAAAGRKKKDPSGLTPAGQLDAVARRAHRMIEDQYACYREQLEPALARAGIRRILPRDVSPIQEDYLRRLFEEELFSVITPTAYRPDRTFPLLRNMALYVAIRLKAREEGAADDYAFIPLGEGVRRFITLPAEEGLTFMLIEDVIHFFKERWFHGREIMECCPFRVTKNADLSVREDMASDLMSGMEDILEERKVSACVRLEIDRRMSGRAQRLLRGALDLRSRDMYPVEGPLDFADFKELAFMDGFDEWKDEVWEPQPSPDIDPRAPMFEVIAEKPVLLGHPYESFDPVVRFVEEAADDPDVLAIKQILYRTSSRSPIVRALGKAARNGKVVTAIVELKARFDEERNIGWAQQLEREGVQVIYGVRGLKTHAKVCVIVRRESGGIAKYAHFGTGNYNDVTARIYSDISYLTADPDLCADATAFFNAISGLSEPPAFLKLGMSPLSIRDTLLDYIDSEIERCRQGQEAHIMAKMNSLVDTALIERLYKASRAGVRVDLNVRGICCLVPGVAGLSERIRVTSIVDRYLEHARIYYFRQGGEPHVFISSADWMPRNLDKRVELLVPVEEKSCARRLIDMLNVYFRDNVNCWELQADGSYTRLRAANRNRFRGQAVLYRRACEAVEQARQAGRLKFKPHRPAGAGG